MNAILVKIFATALALSQVMTRPDAVRNDFDPNRDQTEVVGLLEAGCAHMLKVFDVEAINLDDLIATAMDDPQASMGGIKALHGLKFDDLLAAYRQFCKKERVENSPIDIAEVIAFYDRAATTLPDDAKLKSLMPSSINVVLDRKGGAFAELSEREQRRIVVPLGDIPDFVQKAFVSAEDKRFFEHRGIDERGMIRAFVGNLAEPGRPRGGSTITQQVIKNLLVGDDVTYERKIREILIASRIERMLSKQQILSLYLNSIYLGRGSWGVEMAARSYFGKSVKALTLPEGALLAGLTKGPNYFNPDRHPERARERLTYVLSRMQEDGAISTAEGVAASRQLPRLTSYERLRRDSGFYFVDHLAREVKGLTQSHPVEATSFTVHSTVDLDLQRATETALQDGLAQYEQRTGRAQFPGPEANLSESIQRLETERKTGATGPEANEASKLSKPLPAWQQALQGARLPHYDVHWPTAVVLALPSKNSGIRVGLKDGRIVPLTLQGAHLRKGLKLYDVVFVQMVEGRASRALLRIPPVVEGAAVVIENKSGRILAMAGGFSYPVSQLNRTTQMRRQPGSALKPITYLAALQAGLQPNTLVLDEPITLPPVGDAMSMRERDYWSPKNYDNGSSGVVTLRRALENSKNQVTARLLDGGVQATPEASLDRVCEIAMEAQLYKECVRYYPFVLGAQPVRMIDLAAFYAAIANEGARPTPYAVESIEQDGRVVYGHDGEQTRIGSADATSFYQLKTMLQGVLERGTARQIRQLAPYAGGKTGTSENENDAWFVGLTNEVTVAVWVGYDNAEDRRRTLGGGQTGAKVAIPIFEPIIQAVWSSYAPRTALNPPSPAARPHLADVPIDLTTGDRAPDGRGFVEHFRIGNYGEIEDTQYRLVSRSEVYAYRDDLGEGGPSSFEYPSRSTVLPWRYPSNPQPPPWGAWFRSPYGWTKERARPRRVDPDYFWGYRRN
jgi:penicillin-binding protein 1A